MKHFRYLILVAMFPVLGALGCGDAPASTGKVTSQVGAEKADSDVPPQTPAPPP